MEDHGHNMEKEIHVLEIIDAGARKNSHKRCMHAYDPPCVNLKVKYNGEKCRYENIRWTELQQLMYKHTPEHSL